MLKRHFSVDELHGGSGLIARDDSGASIVAPTRWCPNVSNALVAEPRACRDGVQLAADSNLGSYSNLGSIWYRGSFFKKRLPIGSFFRLPTRL